jgi:hypothetical protein
MKFVGDQLTKDIKAIGLSSEMDEAETKERIVSCASSNACQFREYVNKPV